MKEEEEIKRHVRRRYARVAERAEERTQEKKCGKTCCCGTMADYMEKIGYGRGDVKSLPEEALNVAAGCGNPSALAGLKKGEVVLDLGSGGGIDVLLAARRVGPQGKAIGVDMTPEMIELATRNAGKLGVNNVEFRLGDIETLPLEDESVDVVISNCVINLAYDKDKVFGEMYRVLRPGGRILVSDTVTEGSLPREVRDSLDAWAGCVAGALELELYLDKLRKAGFKDVSILSVDPFMDYVSSANIEAHKPPHI